MHRSSKLIEPRSQFTRVAQRLETAINNILIPPNHMFQTTCIDQGFDLLAVKAFVTLNIKAIGAAGNRPMRVHLAYAFKLIQQWADNWVCGLSGEVPDASGNLLPLTLR